MWVCFSRKKAIAGIRFPTLLRQQAADKLCVRGSQQVSGSGPGSPAPGAAEFHWPRGKNTFPGQTLYKYLRSDICLFNKIACLSTFKLEFVFSHRSSPNATRMPVLFAGSRCPAALGRDALPFVPPPTADFDSARGSQPFLLLLSLQASPVLGHLFVCSMKILF